MSRTEDLAGLAASLAKRYPKAAITTNADTNPATPMAVTAKWKSGRISKTVRADSPSSTIEDLSRKAVAALDMFQQDNVPSTELQ